MTTEVDARSSAQQADGTFPRDDKQEEAERPYADDDDDELNEVEANGNWTPQEKALHEARLKAKAKRRLRKSSSRNSTSDSLSESGETAGADPSSPKGKVPASDRKSRTGKGRGLPKKGGAGGKGVWGAAGMVYEDEEPDLQDPNYDESAQGDTVYAKVVPELDKRDLGKMVNPIVQEYFEHGDTKEVQMLGQFIARAIADHVLPMSFLDCYKGKVDCDHARVALDRAAVLLSIKGAMVRLDNVWGVGGGLRPVKHLIKEMNLLLKEYLTSGDVLEAERCLRELEVPHFHHELVYEAVVMVLESKGDSASPMIIKLLQSLWKTGHLTVDQMNRGFQRVYDELPEINLDVPHAHTIMETFVDLCYQESVISKQLRDACPSRGRKRMVSEGDGGKIKN
ncbi:programmed cell death protein 4a isoform X2 [Syngnathoides biaculeatus]|uniref:programmed cell death protein 4a isoform X2 n=1 Tax=Syngnathoides biaculeatus TaxID=300417 RepID=UPI002ADE79DF|nr:programmed cell death protein 4a isoform X2 [Syngnathoides biaculeatus]